MDLITVIDGNIRHVGILLLVTNQGGFSGSRIGYITYPITFSRVFTGVSTALQNSGANETNQTYVNTTGIGFRLDSQTQGHYWIAVGV